MTFILAEGPIAVPSLAGIVIYGCRFDSEQYDDTWFERLAIDRPLFLDDAVRSRRAEYLAGRHCASRGLAAIGIVPRSIRMGALRQPLFPAPSAGSISHIPGRACAAVVAGGPSMVGIDVQDVIDAPTAREIAPNIVTPEEEAMLFAVFGERAITVAFSIKETFFKAACPQVGRYFGFEEVAVTHVRDAGSTVELTAVRGTGDALRAGARAEVRLTWLDEQTVLSVLAGEAHV